jgi:transcriptional regulator with XRE-family HTH domain
MAADTTERRNRSVYADAIAKLGDRIRDARKEKGLTQEDLSEALSRRKETKTSRITIGVWERNETQPNIDQVFAIAQITGVDPVWLFSGLGGDDSQSSRLFPVPKVILDDKGDLETVGTSNIVPEYFEDMDVDLGNIMALNHEQGQCSIGAIDWVFFDPTMDEPSMSPEPYLYVISEGEPAVAVMRKVAPKDGRSRVNVKNSDLLIDDTLFLDETRILGKVVRWIGS